MLFQVLFKDGLFQWKRLENLIVLAKENVAKMSNNPALKVKDTFVFLKTLSLAKKTSLFVLLLSHSVILIRGASIQANPEGLEI